MGDPRVRPGAARRQLLAPGRPSDDAGAIADTVRLVLLTAALGLAVLGASWAAMVALAARLPPGAARDLAAFLPDCATTLRALRRHPAVPRRARVALAVAAIWVLSPIDLIPEFLPVIGPLDDVVVVALALRYAARRTPRPVILAAWPGSPRLIERLLGPERPGPGPTRPDPTRPDPT